MELRSYQRINVGDDNEDNDCDEVVLSPLQQPSAPVGVSSSTVRESIGEGTRKGSGDNREVIRIKVLKGEESKDITVPKLASVGQLKTLIESAYSVPVVQQRLVYKGKPLRPDDGSLSSFQVADGSTLHLFPLPANAVQNPSSTDLENNTSPFYNWSIPRDNHIPGLPAHMMRPVHFVPEVVQSIREVKMWCYILIITSSMDLFTNLSFLGSQGHAGRSLLDAIVNIIQSIFSIAGLYVGQMGLRCTTTAETDSIKQYVYSLSGLAVLNIMLKVVWVVDVILLAKKSLRQTDQDGDDDEGQDDGRNGKGGGQYVDDPDGEEDENPMSNSSFMIYFSIQAVIMALIAVSMWVACVNRARTFQRVVQSYEGIATRA